MKCIYCGSEDVIYRKFHHIWECQDCGESFDPDERERRLAEKYPDDPNLQRDMSVSYNKLGDIAKARNDYNAAEGYYAKDLKSAKNLRKSTRMTRTCSAT